MNERVYLNDNWIFHEGWEDALLREYDTDGSRVRLPHTVKEVSFHYFDERVYQVHSTYQRQLRVPGDWTGRRLLLSFEGVAHRCRVYVNGQEAASHHCGYTSFRTDISELVEYGYTNLIVVLVDSTKEAADYTRTAGEALFGGIIRDVYLDIRHPVFMDHVFYQPMLQEVPKTKGMSLARLREVTMAGKILSVITLSPQGQKMAKDRRLFVCQFLDGRQISNQPLPPNGRTTTLAGSIHLWDTASPVCYEIRTEIRLDGEVIDVHADRIGFRHIRWRGASLELNGRKLAIRGLVRRQSFPYVGEAMPESIQREDARILKKELGVNAVRTPYYPPSRYFLRGCDDEGILAFVDIPGQKSPEETTANIENVIRSLCNHPCIMVWGMPKFAEDDGADRAEVREASRRACVKARELDPTRACAGIYDTGSNEDAPEDILAFEERNGEAAAEAGFGSAGAGSLSKPVLLASFRGEAAEAGMSDSSKPKQDQMLFHAHMLDAMAAKKLAGGFGEAMCDYFGDDGTASRDGLCRFGVMDAFRNPKPAAFLYASQPGRGEVLALSDHAPDGRTYILSNAEKIRLYRDGEEIFTYTKGSARGFERMRHGPIEIRDWLGNVLETKEGLSGRQREWVRTVFRDLDRYGAIRSVKAGLASLELEKITHLDQQAVWDMYRKYNDPDAEYCLEAENDGEVVARLVRMQGRPERLQAVASSRLLKEVRTYDVAAVRVNVLDEQGNVPAHYDGILQIEVSGAIALIGPRLLSFCGGCCGFYVRTTGEPGKGMVRIRTMDMDAETIAFEVRSYRT